MRIILYEIRKLLNWKVIFLVLFISLLFFELFLKFDFEHFPNGRPAGDSFKITKQMIETYGVEMDEQEFLDFKEAYKKEIEKANAYLQSRDDFVEAGVTTYKQFNNMGPETDDLYTDVVFDKGIDIFWELQARENFIENYENRKEIFLATTDHVDDPEWKQEILDSNAINGLLEGFVWDNYNRLVTMFAILVIVVVMIVVGRVFITDQKNNMIILQYTALVGRNLYKKKITAALFTAFLITSFYVGVFLILYAGNGTQPFFQTSLHSFQTPDFWLNLTFFQYIVLTIIGVYVLALVAAAFAIFLSRVTNNFTSLIGSQIPIVVLLYVLISEYLIAYLTQIKYPLSVTIGTYIGLIVLGTATLWLRWRKEKQIDIA